MLWPRYGDARQSSDADGTSDQDARPVCVLTVPDLACLPCVGSPLPPLCQRPALTVLPGRHFGTTSRAGPSWPASTASCLWRRPVPLTPAACREPAWALSWMPGACCTTCQSSRPAWCWKLRLLWAWCPALDPPSAASAGEPAILKDRVLHKACRGPLRIPAVPAAAGSTARTASRGQGAGSRRACMCRLWTGGHNRCLLVVRCSCPEAPGSGVCMQLECLHGGCQQDLWLARLGKGLYAVPAAHVQE